MLHFVPPAALPVTGASGVERYQSLAVTMGFVDVRSSYFATVPAPQSSPGAVNCRAPASNFRPFTRLGGRQSVW